MRANATAQSVSCLPKQHVNQLTPSTAGSLNNPAVGGVGSMARSLTSVARNTTVPYEVSEGGMNSAGGRRDSVPIDITKYLSCILVLWRVGSAIYLPSESWIVDSA
jgi:hypothetical protein